MFRVEGFAGGGGLQKGVEGLGFREFRVKGLGLYLEGHGDLVTRLVVGIIWGIIWPIGVINLLLSPRDPPNFGFRVGV